MIIRRGTSDHTHPYRLGSTQGTFDIMNWCRANGTASGVRLNHEEYSRIPLPGGVFTHFNLQRVPFVPDKLYAGLEIISHGYIDENSEVLPLIKLDHWYTLKCLSVRNCVPHTEITPEEIKTGDLRVRTIDDLQAKVWEKYHQSLPELSFTDFVTAGLAVTRFQVVRLNHHSNFPGISV